MKVTGAKFVRRYNVAQFEHEEYSLEAVVEDGESPITVLNQLKSDVAAAYAGETGPEAEEAQPEKKEKKKKSSTPAPKEEEVGDEDLEADDLETDSDLEDSEEEVVEEEEEEEAPKPAKKASATSTKKTTTASPGKAKKAKEQTYDRSIEAHKELFSGVLRGVAPDWKKSDASKSRAKQASAKMEGIAFLDSNGEVLKEFKLQVKKLMAGK